MPPTTMIGMTITTTTTSSSPMTAVDESSQQRRRRTSRMRWQQLMPHPTPPPPPPPPISSVLIRSSQSTKAARRSMTTSSSTEDIYEDQDDEEEGSVSSCSMEVMSVNAPYAFYFHDSMEAWYRQEQNHSSSNTSGCSGDSQDDEEEDSTADSTGSGVDVDPFAAYVAYYHDHGPEATGRPSTRPRSRRRRSPQGKLPPQQMARILACSSPEITALCKSSFPQPTPTASMEHHQHNSTRGRLRLPVPPPHRHSDNDEMMSIGTPTDDDDALVDESFKSPERPMESCGITLPLSLPPPPNGTPPMIHGERTAAPSSPDVVRSDDFDTSRRSNLPPPPNWTDVWLREHGDAAIAEASHAELIPSSSCEADDPYASFRSSSYPPIMFDYSDRLIIGGPMIRSHDHASSSPINTLKKSTTTRTLPPERGNQDAAVIDPLSKLSLHRRVSIDQLPSWNEIADRNTTTNDTLAKLVLRKTVTAVSDES